MLAAADGQLAMLGALRSVRSLAALTPSLISSLLALATAFLPVTLLRFPPRSTDAQIAALLEKVL